MSTEESSLQELAMREPWRTARGTPRNALDPTWIPGVGDECCDGRIIWEGKGPWWFCNKCGYIGSSPTPIHKPIQHPLDFFMASIFFYIRKGLESPTPVTKETALFQALYVTGVALRNAVVQRSRLGLYLEQLLAK